MLSFNIFPFLHPSPAASRHPLPSGEDMDSGAGIEPGSNAGEGFLHNTSLAYEPASIGFRRFRIFVAIPYNSQTIAVDTPSLYKEALSSAWSAFLFLRRRNSLLIQMEKKPGAARSRSSPTRTSRYNLITLNDLYRSNTRWLLCATSAGQLP